MVSPIVKHAERPSPEIQQRQEIELRQQTAYLKELQQGFDGVKDGPLALRKIKRSSKASPKLKQKSTKPAEAISNSDLFVSSTQLLGKSA